MQSDGILDIVPDLVIQAGSSSAVRINLTALGQQMLNQAK